MSSNIFAGVEPPAWLVERANVYRPGAMGNVLGTALAGGVNAISDGTSFGQGLAESRASQQDPLWEPKLQLATSIKQAQIASTLANAESAHWLAQERKDESINWMDDVNSGAASYLTDPNPQTPPPIAKSQKMNTLLRMKADNNEKFEIARQANEVRKQSSRVALATQNELNNWNNTLGQIDPTIKASILAMPNQGFVLDANGKPLYPSPDAINLANGYLTKNGMLPFGATSKQLASTGSSAAIRDAQQVDEWEKKAADAAAAGDQNEAARFTKLANNLKVIKHMPIGDGEPKFYTDPQTNRRYIQFPGYAPKELKDLSQENQAKADLHDYYKASDNYYRAKEMGMDADTLNDRLSDLAAKRKAIQKYHSGPLPTAQGTTQPPAPTTVQPTAQPTSSATSNPKDPLNLFQ